MANSDWISGNRYLEISEMHHNAVLFRNWFQGGGVVGVTTNAIAGMLGNIQSESRINPGMWESLIPYPPYPFDDNRGGYGLCQWTPYFKLQNWYNNPNYFSDVALIGGDDQCARIFYEAQNNLQWGANDSATPVRPPITLMEFLQSDLPPATLANYFLWYYERPSNINQPGRATQANYWYEYLTGEAPPTPHTKKKSMPLWFFMRPF